MTATNGSSPAVIALADAPGPARIVDVLVVGTGAAGLSAALAASSAGSEAILLEKAAKTGGTTRKSSGWAWYPNNSWMVKRGIEDRKEDAMRYMGRVAGAEHYDPRQPRLGLPEWQYEMLDTFYDEAAKSADALSAAGVRLRQAIEFPDYFSYLPEDKAPYGRVITPETLDGEPGVGDDMVDQLATVVEAKGVPVLLEHQVTALVMDEGAAVGLVVETPEGTVAFGARRGVVFGSGGFGQNPELRREMLAMPTFGSCAAQSNTGDFVGIATQLGLPLRSMAYPWMTPMVLERALRNPADVHSLYHAPGDSMLWVNCYGDRVLNEKAPYNELVRDMMRWDGRRAEYPDLIQVMVWDEACHRIHAGEQRFNPMRLAGADDAHIVRAETLPELVAEVSARLERVAEHTGGVRLDPDFEAHLKASIARFNKGAENGADPDFARGETDIERTFNSKYGAPRSEVNPMLFPLAAEGPYYATLVAPGMLDTKGGPRTDTGGRILDALGHPVPGLFGAGNCVAGFSGRSYWGAGATIGPAVTFGRLAGSNAAQEPERALAARVGAAGSAAV